MVKEIWSLKYRPKKTEDYVWINTSQRNQVKEWVEEKSIPHLLLIGHAGVGKTSLAIMLMNELDVDPSDIKMVNGSTETGIDFIRSLDNFISTMPIGDCRYVILDECLDQNTLVWVLRDGIEKSIPIKDLDQSNDLVKSYNLKHSRIEWRPFELMDKGDRDVLQIEFENGEIVVCTPNHKWYVENPLGGEPVVVRADQLDGHILSNNGDVLQKFKIKSITKLDSKRKVYDLSVQGNHNFIIGNNKILTHNCDYLSPNAQAALRNMIETYTSNARFILTANYSHKVLPALKSRCVTFEIGSLDKTMFVERIATILVNEGVELTEENLEILDDYVNASYPDLRKCINLLQQNCIGSVLQRPDVATAGTTAEIIITAVAMFRNGQISEARKFLAPKLNAHEFDDAYKLLYQNLDWWGKKESQHNMAIITIAKYMRDHAVVSDPEICFAACLVELEEIALNG